MDRMLRFFFMILLLPMVGFSIENVALYINFFVVGFGKGHMWVKEIVNGEISDKRLILVEF